MIYRKFLIIIATILNLGSYLASGAFLEPAKPKEAIPGNLNPAVYPELTKFIKLYRCSNEFEARKSEHFAKGGQVDRLINAVRANRVIEQKGLTSLQVPHKCLSKNKDGNYEVLAEGLKYAGLVERFNNSEISLSEVQQIVAFVEETGYSDLHGGNLIRTLDNKIAICDTEDRSFIMFASSLSKLKLLCAVKNFLDVEDGTSKINYSFVMDSAGKAFFREKLAKTAVCDNDVLSLKANTAYDDQEIDFEKVKSELSMCRQRSNILSPCYWFKAHCVDKSLVSKD